MAIPTERFPFVPTYTERASDGVWCLFVLCPFCGERHQHGGGSGARPGLGHRLSHCIRGDQRESYVLVTGPSGMAKPPTQTRGWQTRQWRAGADGRPPLAPINSSASEFDGRTA